MKYIKLHLSIHADQDLLILHNDRNFNLKKSIYDSLKAYLSNETFEIDVRDVYIPNYVLNTQHIYIPIDENKDKDLEDWLNCIKHGQKSVVIKNIFRYYYNVPFVNHCFKNTPNTKNYQNNNNKTQKNIKTQNNKVSNNNIQNNNNNNNEKNQFINKNPPNTNKNIMRDNNNNNNNRNKNDFNKPHNKQDNKNTQNTRETNIKTVNNNTNNNLDTNDIDLLNMLNDNNY